MDGGRRIVGLITKSDIILSHQRPDLIEDGWGLVARLWRNGLRARPTAA